MKFQNKSDGVANQDQDVNDSIENDQESGDSTDNVNSENDKAKKNSVSYESYQRLLAQRKRDQERLAQYENSLKEQERIKREQEESKLAEKGEYKKLLETRELQIRALNEELDRKSSLIAETESQLINRQKFEAVLSRLPGRLADKEYYNLIDFGKIAVDPETREIDEDSVDEVVNAFVKKHGRLFDKKEIKMPSDANTGAMTKIEYQAWCKLPWKEQKKYTWDQLKNVPK